MKTVTKKGTDMEYLTAEPSSLPQDGRVLVHNDVLPVAHRQGTHGSRFWLQQPDPSLLLCTCGWAPAIGQHFRVSRLEAEGDTA